ncbi:MBL fold metallo-hydrolase [Dehalococcoides mccartyi]|uniref:MBL fold metallo-hydrolase n=1 Tax=Dehalococcoides mccartyi TaxID=61435 RepID=UPI003390D90F
MEIKWLGHSCFRLKGKNTTVITDPFPSSLGFAMGKQSAEVVTISHAHANHSFTSAIDGNPHIVSGPGEYEIGDVIILGLSTFHDDAKGSELGKNTIYQMEIDDLSICHLGDIGQGLTDSQIEELGRVDILLLPVGGGNTVSPGKAAEIMRKLEPSIVIPMHFQSDLSTSSLLPIGQFLKEIGISNLEPQSKLNITRGNLPVTTQVMLLQP